jgi:hypothetical protein
MKRLFCIVASIVMLAASTCEARKRAETYTDKNGVKRVQKSGKVYRDYKAVNDFKRQNPKPKDGHAYDIDHVKPLKAGGADKPSNMQWIKTEDHRKKSAKE